MVEKPDIDSLLSTGSWRTSRSRSPNPYGSQRRAHEQTKSNIGVPRIVELPSRSKRPPPPCVEDEEVSLAKEHTGSIVNDTSDEEPKCRGEIDQQPILLPVHEYNPERRFIIVPGAAVEDAPKTTQARYEANTCRKYVLVTPEKPAEGAEGGKEEKHQGDLPKQKLDLPKKEKEQETRELPKRKSHQDLPRLNTAFENHEPSEPSLRRSNSRRERERPLVHQDQNDHHSSRERSSARPPDSEFLSPEAVKHSSRRRDRSYSDARSDSGRRPGRSPSAMRDAEIEVSDRRQSRHSSKYSASSSLHRRASSTANVPIRDAPASERPKSFMQPYAYRDPEEIFAFMAPGDDFVTGRPAREASPPRRRRNSKSPPHPRGAREMPAPSPSRRRQPRPNPREQDGYSSDDSYRERRPGRGERPYPIRSTLEPEYPPMLSPDQARRPNPKLGGIPIPSLAPPQSQYPDEPPHPSPRSATFPADKSRMASNCSPSPSPPVSPSPSRRPDWSNKSAPSELHSRDASIGSTNGSASLPPQVPGSLGRTGTLEKPVAGQVVNLLRDESSDLQSPAPYWQSARPDEEEIVDCDATCRALVQLPECRSKSPAPARNRPGSEHFLTLKRAENFTICPDCYRFLFANTEFQNLFVPVHIRSGDQFISCDFGASPWYRIAYILTLKHEYPDLRLLQGIASVAARTQVCGGEKVVPRIWYSMMAPNSRRPIQTFNICLGCARMIEVLLPNLAGSFIPLDSHEPTRGICELYFTPDRKRFLTYFKLMEETSDRALTRRIAPNIVQLADRIREISLRDECLRNTPIPNRKWHILQRVPDFTVCEECFETVVLPMIEDEGNPSEIPRNFYKHRQLRPVAACQLYSDRMRAVFLEACKYDDFEYLASRVLNRMRVMAEIRARYNELRGEDQEAPEVKEELAGLARRLREVE
ncbi:hypothetical protein VTI74DRAFT_8494 [Chaetomium olivicolor]